ncbi:hypothetical protein LCGC14_1628400 [marine sediment metagenome]|uniref:N-acetylmuramoyl-L-alanine amidase domain-containing protein n=1 Tax=marine sediment metagenome TaxID=412755 RepID=A0A0F9I3D4_9ZZZZ
MTVIDVTKDYPIPLVWPRPAMDLKRVDGIAIHHTVTFFLSPSATVLEELAHIDMIHAYHKSKGWGGFAYHLISFPSGRVYLVVPLTQWGAHVHAENDHLHAVVVAGDFTARAPILAQQQGVAEGIRLIYTTLGRQVSIRPHRAWTATSCPGATWDQWVPGLTELVEEEDNMTPEQMAELKAFIKHQGLQRDKQHRAIEGLVRNQGLQRDKQHETLRELCGDGVFGLGDDDLLRIAKAVVDEQFRRLKD